MAKITNKRLSKRNTHNRKVIKLIKFSTIICFIFLVIEVVYIMDANLMSDLICR